MIQDFYLFILVMTVILSGCTITVNEPLKPSAVAQSAGETAKQLIDLNAIAVGTSMDQVKSAIGDSVTIGQTIKQEGQTQAITVKSLYKEEKLQVQGFNYQVLFYFTQIVHPDDQITDDECTPLVFQNGILISKTWDEFNKIKSKQ